MITPKWCTWLAIIIMAVAWPTENLLLWMTGCVLLIKVVNVKTEKYQNEMQPYWIYKQK